MQVQIRSFNLLPDVALPTRNRFSGEVASLRTPKGPRSTRRTQEAAPLRFSWRRKRATHKNAELVWAFFRWWRRDRERGKRSHPRNTKRARGMQRCIDFESELLQIQTAQEPVLRADVCARALHASQDVKENRGFGRRAMSGWGVWVSAGVEDTRIGRLA